MVIWFHKPLKSNSFSGPARRKQSLLVHFLPRTMCPRWNKGHRWCYAASRLFKLGLSLWTPSRCGQSCVSIWFHQYCCTPLSKNTERRPLTCTFFHCQLWAQQHVYGDRLLQYSKPVLYLHACTADLVQCSTFCWFPPPPHKLVWKQL